MSDPFMGTIMMVSFGFAPKNWAFCNGQLLSIAQNQALFSLLGTTYGGNGQTTFALPDLRGRTPLHFGSNFPLGTRTGSETVTLTTANLPAHNHTFSVLSLMADKSDPAGNFLGVPSGADIYSNQSSGFTATSTMLASTGGNQPISNEQPYLAINFVIALAGIFPSQN